MKKMEKADGNVLAHALAAGLILTVGCWRALASGGDEWSNFSPVMAVVFCGAVYLRSHWRWVIPALALGGSDFILGHPVGSWTIATYGSYALAFGLGLWVCRGKSWGKLFGGLAAGSLLFYLTTSTASWVANPTYLKSLSGWFQALTIGDPAYQPQAWTFFRNSLLSDLFFGGLFAGIMEWTAARSGFSSLWGKANGRATA